MIMNISQINNAIAVVIPPAFVQSLNLDKNSQVEVRLENNQIQILPINNKVINQNKPTGITPSVAKVGGILQAFTDKKLSIEQMNNGVEEYFRNLDKTTI